MGDLSGVHAPVGVHHDVAARYTEPSAEGGPFAWNDLGEDDNMGQHPPRYLHRPIGRFTVNDDSSSMNSGSRSRTHPTFLLRS